MSALSEAGRSELKGGAQKKEEEPVLDQPSRPLEEGKTDHNRLAGVVPV